MIYPTGFRRTIMMLENNNTVIEKIFVLKLASLSNKDQNWILKNLKKTNKNIHKQIQTKLHEAKEFNLNHVDFNNIYNSLNLDKYFEKNDLDKKIDVLNDKLEDYVDELTANTDVFGLLLFLYCDDALKVKQFIVKKIISSDYFISNKIDLKVVKNDKINTKLINYLHTKYIEKTH